MPEFSSASITLFLEAPNICITDSLLFLYQTVNPIFFLSTSAFVITLLCLLSHLFLIVHLSFRLYIGTK